MNFAIGWACNLNDIFVRFPYEKCKNLIKLFKTKAERRKKIKQVFREGVSLILLDIVENNATFKIQGIVSQGGEIHMEAVKDLDFIKARKKGKFSNVDFLESNFTGFLMYLYIHSKRDNFLHGKKFPIYVNKFYRDIITEHTNRGENYC